MLKCCILTFSKLKGRNIQVKKVEVVAAIIFHNNEIFCARRGASSLDYISRKYEFPGGKIEENESRIDALCRELREELNIQPDILSTYLTVVHTYPDFELTMHSYICKVNTKELKLNEHISCQWVRRENLLTLDWAAADIPIVHKLMGHESDF